MNLTKNTKNIFLNALYDLRNSYKPVCEHFLKGGSQRLTWSDAGVLASSHSNGEIMTYLDAHVGPMQCLKKKVGIKISLA